METKVTEKTKNPATAPAAAPAASKDPLSRFSPAEIVALANEVRGAGSGDGLLFNYVLTNGKPKDKHVPSIRKILGAAVDLGHNLWPAEIKGILQRRDVLHFGCGATLYGPVFRALGAASYTGMDKALDLSRKKFRSRLEKKTVETGFSLQDVIAVVPGLTYVRGEEMFFRDAFDLIVMQSVTQTLPNLAATLATFHQALRPGGEIWFLHENFYAWGGHQLAPRNPANFDPKDPAQAAVADWRHISIPVTEGHALAKYNRVSPSQLRRMVDASFEVSQWQEVVDKPSIAERMTDELRRKLPEAGLSERDLLIKQITCRATRRNRAGAGN